MSLLNEIIENKKKEVAALKASGLESDLKKACGKRSRKTGSFKSAILNSSHAVSVIAEFKRKSPSKGVLNPNADLAAIVQGYAEQGADALSILTDQKYFDGSLDDLRTAAGLVSAPVLRKDFMIDAIQVYEAGAADADCILLIAACLTDDAIRQMHDAAGLCGLDVLIEVHDEVELRRALKYSDAVLGINNRNLNTFQVSLKTTERLMAKIPRGRLVISESGIKTKDDLRMLKAFGVRGALVGEAFMTEKNPALALKRLLS
jgi:indole-3-glycerol phosphate synthase